MRILLAPMEGVIDHTMRDMLTQIGGIDRCVTEFIRVTESKLPSRVFYRLCPELLEQGHHSCGHTRAGVPVYVQLLGSHCEFMALNAQQAVALGAPGIDINFGCPAKTVNRNDGGSVLLKEPERIFSIVNAVRQAIPTFTPLTVKVRLGFANSSLFADVVDAVIAAGANEITVHARTREDGYRPPAYWHEINRIKGRCAIPIIANGEIWNPEDANKCRVDSGCTDIMLGRGILACPDLARQISALQQQEDNQTMAWCDVLCLLLRFHELSLSLYDRRYVGNRLKQWLGYLRRRYQHANRLFENIKRLRCPDAINHQLKRELSYVN